MLFYVMMLPGKAARGDGLIMMMDNEQRRDRLGKLARLYILSYVALAAAPVVASIPGFVSEQLFFDWASAGSFLNADIVGFLSMPIWAMVMAWPFCAGYFRLRSLREKVNGEKRPGNTAAAYLGAYIAMSPLTWMAAIGIPGDFFSDSYDAGQATGLATFALAILNPFLALIGMGAGLGINRMRT